MDSHEYERMRAELLRNPEQVRVLHNAFPFNERECHQIRAALLAQGLDMLADKVLAYTQAQNLRWEEQHRALLDAGYEPKA